MPHEHAIEYKAPVRYVITDLQVRVRYVITDLQRHTIPRPRRELISTVYVVASFRADSFMLGPF